MQSHITVVVMVIVRLATFALPAKSKYAGALPRNYQCRVVITDQTILPMRPGYRHEGAENFYQLSAQVYKGLNCTESYRPSVITTGSRQQDGNYTGILGLLQRDEADFALQVVRVDAIPDHPVHLTSALASAEAAVYSQISLDIENVPDLLDVIDKFKDPILSYFLAMASISAILLSYSLRARRRRNRKVNRRWKRVASYLRLMSTILRKAVELIVDQENFKMRKNQHAGRMLWMFLCFSYLIVMFGYFLNFVSIDKVVYLDADAIHTLSDQLRAPFNVTKKPVAFKNFYLYDYLLKSREGSDLYKLHKLMADNDNLLDLKLDRENEILPAIAKADQAMFAGSSSMVLEKFLYYSLFRNYQCAASGGNDGGIVSAPFADGVLAYFVNRKMDPQLKDFFDRRTKVIFESHVSVVGFKKTGKSLIDMFEKSNYKVYRCCNQLWDKEDRHHYFGSVNTSPYSSVTMTMLDKTLKLCSRSLLLASAILVAEIVITGCYTVFNKTRKRNQEVAPPVG
ncbi:hypothetical protein HDE_07695 [Halotydeus destructor]|nr:hypothetical protein HDE_07695 [Halotydeus destructor]